MFLLSAWLQGGIGVSAALANAFRRLDYDISVEAQVHLSLSSPRSSYSHTILFHFQAEGGVIPL